jgi:ATP-dependent protease ClpP protease subunit
MNEEMERVIADGLLQRRTVELKGEITPELIDQTERKLLYLQMQSNDPIYLIINSGGGHSEPAITLSDVIKQLLSAQVYGIAIGECGSAATFIFLHCHKRLATRNAKFLIHSGSLGFDGFPLGTKSRVAAAQLKQDVDKDVAAVVAIYCRTLKLSKKKVQRLMDRGDQYFGGTMSAKEAKEIGLDNTIVKGTLPIFS